MKRMLTILMAALMAITFSACGSDAGSAAPKANSSAQNAEAELSASKNETVNGKILVAYFSCTGNTKALAETTANILGAELYEIRPEQPYTANDLNYNDETTRATVEQKDDSARPALADKNANIKGYDTIVLAYPIWWGQAPRIMDTFVESYDFSGKTIVPMCTSGGSDIGSSADYLQGLMKGTADWKNGKQFRGQTGEEELKSWLSGLGL